MRTHRTRVAALVMVVSCALQTLNPAPAQAAFLLDKLFGGQEAADKEMRAADVAEASNGSIYVVDNVHSVIHIYNANGDYQESFGGQGREPGQLYFPESIAAHEDTLFVTDSGNSRISMFNLSGGYLGSFGKYGTPDGEFLNPYRIAVDTSGDVFVVDGQKNDVQKFTPGGDYLDKFDTTDFPGGGFSKLSGIAFGPDGNIYLTDELGGRVVKVSPDGDFIAEVGLGQGTTGGYFHGPSDVTVLPNGNIYVVDSGSKHEFPAQAFDSNGTFLYGFGTGKVGYPRGTGSTSTGRLYVTDTANARIWRYREGPLKLIVRNYEDDIYNTHTHTFRLEVGHNSARPCTVGADGTVKAGNKSFKVDRKNVVKPDTIKQFDLAASKAARKAMRAALRDRKKVMLLATMRLECPGGESVEKDIEYRVGRG